MAADTAAKRYSAMNIGSPWRGLNIVPAAIDQAQRQAVMFLYSGILAGASAVAILAKVAITEALVTRVTITESLV